MNSKIKDSSTEEKIKTAAQKLFTEKGFTATTTREIATQAEINPALVNYYFRSKENLFRIIMQEKFLTFFGSLLPVFNDSETSIEEKIQLLSDRYFSMLSSNPDLPIFILGEIHKNPHKFSEHLLQNDFIQNSVLIRQLKAENAEIRPENLLINILGLNIFPFVMKPVLHILAQNTNLELNEIMAERKHMVPLWAKTLLDIKPEKS
ncbi:MAG: TetR/AcrR family transcriptional regulator [Flavobacteriaceae bacterium]|nr:TetR/AcrR family transcriptional regulator [Flavobacteriaceae bacterium]